MKLQNVSAIKQKQYRKPSRTKKTNHQWTWANENAIA